MNKVDVDLDLGSEAAPDASVASLIFILPALFLYARPHMYCRLEIHSGGEGLRSGKIKIGACLAPRGFGSLRTHSWQQVSTTGNER